MDVHFRFAVVFLSILSFCSGHIAAKGSKSNMYSLAYDGLVEPSVVGSYNVEEGDLPFVPYSMVTDLSTEIATDIIQTYSVTKTLSTRTESEVKAEDRQLEMDRRCYKTIMGGGKCTIDHFRPDEVILQISLSFEGDLTQRTTVQVDVALSTQNPGLTRDVLVRSIPIINKRIKCYQAVTWSIRERPSPAFLERSWDETSNMAAYQVHTDVQKASLEHLILQQPQLNMRMRIATANLHDAEKPALEVWSYRTPEAKEDVRALFVDGVLQSTTHHAGTAHAEAFVHPVMNSILVEGQDDSGSIKSRYPERVAILSMEPSAVLREVLKHKSVKSVILLGANRDVLELTTKYLAINNDCSFLARQDKPHCLAQPEVEVAPGEVEAWLDNMITKEASISLFDALFVDVPLGSGEWMDLELQKKLMHIVHNESAAVFAAGSSPIFSDTQADHDLLNHRDAFLHGTSEFPEFLQVFVYDEPLAAPLRSSFIVLFPGDSDSLVNFFRPNSAAIEVEMVKRISVPAGGRPTVVYDGPTHVGYQTPSKAWQNWYCTSPLGKSMYICSTFFADWYDASKHYYRTEVREHPVKGRALYALEDAPAGTFILPDDAASGLRIDFSNWEELNEFIAMFPDAEMYQQLKDFFIAYGFESEPMGQTGWVVSVANNSTFTNHACTKEEENVNYVEGIYLNENGAEINFCPALVRYGSLVGILATAARDIEAGEELQMSYSHFRTYRQEALDELMENMCNSGSGLVTNAGNDESRKEL